MLVYQGIKTDFINDVNLNLIVTKIKDKYFEFFHRSVGKAEINSWKNSMQYMRGVLDDNEIPNNAGIAIEFNIPTTSKRIDFIISGRDNKKNDSVIIVELKQWETVTAVKDKDGIVSTYTGGAIREVTHPSYQAMTYANLIRDFNETVHQENIGLYPCAFLHNYDLNDNDPILDNQYKEYIDEAPLFGSKDFKKLRKFIKKYIVEGDDRELLYKIENGRIKPSKRLQDSLSKMLTGNKEFHMIDDQKVIYEQAILEANNTINNEEKKVLIVQGGPGTGKSVLAVNLLVEFTKRNMTSFYVTKNSAPREVFSKKLKGTFKQKHIDNLFQGSGVFVNSESNELDCLIVDEAHRLNAKSGMFSNLGENQVKEIINASRYSIFFIDENQKVTFKDIGSTQIIKNYAKELNANVSVVDLASQFRCNGSDGYLSWLDNVLEIKETANYDLEDIKYDFQVVDNPKDLQLLINEKNDINNRSRMVAGYCWDWISSGKNDSRVHDIVIDDFSISWNLGNSTTWAIDESSIEEIGCIHTSQGLEFDYVGVIIGDDLRYENDKIVTDFTKRAKTDQSIKGLKKLKKENEKKALEIADEIIKNTYRTLMTRGMKGCYLYCTDKALANYFRERITGTYNL
ncbi:DUF2075 domain-containing protein [Tannockella kyphosi]|uniref:DUF2075 domain-containing protein n=1 Tax=Tannockella kyphosi TaxID=2899121 RepID=UPI002013B405|nr:DUF2075 domain-containing protein [Tannockella kyphosi]